MGMTAAQQQATVDKQVQARKEELRRESVRIADLITAATGRAQRIAATEKNANE